MRQFGALLRSLGITEEGLSFHGLRKLFAHVLDDADGVKAEDIKALLGHARGMTFDVYAGPKGLRRLREVVGKVAYPGLELGHLGWSGGSSAG